jgi:SAM-dependent methyltransferase
MKYNYYNQVIPQEKREDINSKILYCIDNKLCEKSGLTNEIIYNSYTGVGGLHSLNFKDYNSFYSYTEAKKEIENGQFFTNHTEGKFLIDLLKIKNSELILDLTCGSGNLFNFCPQERNCYGNELDIKSYKVARKLYKDSILTHGDMRNYNPKMLFDIVIGNPPFNLKLTYKGEEKLSQLIYIEKSLELLKTGGLMALIVPYSFLNDEFSNKSDIDYMNENFNFIGQIELDKNAFKYLGVENFKTKIVLFSKKSEFIGNKKYENTFIEGSAEEIYNNYILPIRQLQEKNRSKIRLENMKNYSDSDKIFDDKVRKLLFDIKQNKKINHLYNECNGYYQSYYNQVQPKNISNEEWNNIKITKEKVINKLKLTLSNQHEKIVIKSENKFKTIQRKKKLYDNQSIPFDSMKIDNNINTWLKKLTLENKYTGEKIKLNSEQLAITNKMLQKKYGYIQSSQGTGKTIMSIAYSLHRKNHTNVKNTIVIAPSIAINGTWIETLEEFDIPYVTIKSISDIEKIKQGDFVLITFNMICKLHKHMKNFTNKISHKYTLIVDEADSICNLNSKRTKATLSVGKKAKYKLLLSGTMTRNNIVESYTQFNLLYGSSYNFMNECDYIMEEDKESKNLIEKTNYHSNKPFPEYKKGLELFKKSFNPQKITVFGVGKNTQDIYNSDKLKKIIDKTIITRSFEDVVGKKIYSINQHLVNFNESEEILYHKAIKEFYSMKYLFTSTGNPRKDRMLEIIQQINLLLNICKHPQTFKEYSSIELPSKYKKVLDLVNKWESEYVAIGCRSLKEIGCYSNLLNKYTDRKIFIITGATPMDQRKNIVNNLKQSKNGILLSTQQSLSSSISINFVNKVICTALSWNWSTLSQYFFRFIRYNSTDFKEVHFVTYSNSLESNLLSLIASKENLNNFMKNQEMDSSEVEEELGINFDLISMLLSKEKDEEGRTYINWGNQNIC